MTLDEAIRHELWCARESQGETAEEHMQMAEWLCELRRLRSQLKWLRKEYTSLSKTRKREFAKSCEAATNNMGQIGTLRDKNAELRELVRDMWDVALHPETFGDGGYLLRRMRDLGIEVDDE